MAILNRFARLLTADIHAVMDRLEEPRAQLQQALRELDEAQLLGASRVRQIEQQLSALQQQQVALDEQQANCQRELDLCLAATQEALAKKVVRRQLQVLADGCRIGVEVSCAEPDELATASRARRTQQHLQVRVDRRRRCGFDAHKLAAEDLCC